jgi:pSer/pThr/pTyr-binding forkhead associated (FHA) protein
MEVRLVILHGEHQGREIPLPETMFLIGRDDQCHLRPHCPRVSRRHCAIATWAGKVRVRDLHSRNGTFLNGQRIAGEVAVEDGDQLRVGTQVFAVQIKHVPGELVGAPIKSEGEVDWLLQSPASVESLSAATATREFSLGPESPQEAERMMCDVHWLDAETASNSQPATGRTGISAGNQFRDYFAQRKRS